MGGRENMKKTDFLGAKEIYSPLSEKKPEKEKFAEVCKFDPDFVCCICSST